MRYECNFCNPKPCVFDCQAPDNCKPTRCPIMPDVGDDDTGGYWKSAPLIKESAEKSYNTESEAITLLKECAAINGQVHRQEWFVNNKKRINAVLA